MKLPPCWHDNRQGPPNTCAAALYQQTVYNHHWLSAEWLGWRFAGRDLVSPEGDRITPERLRGLLWRQQAEVRPHDTRRAREKRASGKMVTVIRVENRGG